MIVANKARNEIPTIQRDQSAISCWAARSYSARWAWRLALSSFVTHAAISDMAPSISGTVLRNLLVGALSLTCGIMLGLFAIVGNFG